MKHRNKKNGFKKKQVHKKINSLIENFPLVQKKVRTK